MSNFASAVTIFAALFILLLSNSCSAVKEARRAADTLPTASNSIGDDTTLTYEILPTIEVLPANYQPAATMKHDLVHTKLAVSFDWDNERLIGQATLTLKPHFYPTNTLMLDAKYFNIKRIELIDTNPSKTISQQATNKPLSYQYDKDSLKLTIALDREYKHDEQFSIFIDYVADPQALVNRHGDRFNYDTKGLYFIKPDSLNLDKPYQIWTQGETYGASCWYPTIDSPNQKTTEEVYITVDDKFSTLSNGQLISSTGNPDGTRTDYWKQDIPHAPYLFVVAVGDYFIYKDKWRNKEVNYYVEPKYGPYAKHIFGHTPEMIEYYSQLLGYDFPWDKYSQAVVRDFIAGAMENTSATLLYEELQTTDKETEQGAHDDIIAHELFHQWFGDLVTCESWANLALNESFATYGEYLWLDHKYGRETAEEHLARDLSAYLMEAEYKQASIIRYYYVNADDDLFDRHSYQKGGRVLHMLRRYVGDDAFFTAIKNYLHDHAFKTAEIHNLRFAFEKITGEDLNWFFDQWFLTPGHPELDITYSYDTTTQVIIVQVNQTQPDEKIYRLPTYIDVYYKDGSKEHHAVTVEKRQQTFSFKAKSTPKNINFDPEKVLLCNKTEHKGAQGYIHQFYNAPGFLDQWEALKALLQQPDEPNVRPVLIQAAQSPSKYLRKEALKSFDPAWVAQHPDVQKVCLERALNDSIAEIQTTALQALLAVRSPEYTATLAQLAQNAQNEVALQALKTLFTLNVDHALSTAAQMEETDNNALINTLALLYAEHGGPKQQTFFEKKLPIVDRFNRFNLIDKYGTYLTRCQGDTCVIQRALPLLENIAKNDNNWWLRLHTTQTIDKILSAYHSQYDNVRKNGFDTKSISIDKTTQIRYLDNQIKSVEASLSRIKSGETNQQVLEYYKKM